MQSAIELLSSRNVDASGCVLWATSAVNGLAYLDDLDTALDGSPRMATGHDALVVDVAHARWAAGTAMTALDLCAAAIGLLYLPARTRYYDMGDVLCSPGQGGQGRCCEHFGVAASRLAASPGRAAVDR
jgi:hypothetical protein